MSAQTPQTCSSGRRRLAFLAAEIFNKMGNAHGGFNLPGHPGGNGTPISCANTRKLGLEGPEQAGKCAASVAPHAANAKRS